MSMPVTLIVDDEPDIRELLQITLNRMDIETVAADNIADAKRLFDQGAFDLCLTDMRLPDGDGLSLLDYINRKSAHLPVVVITAHGNMDTAVKAMKLGAFDFLSKPVDLESLRQLIRNALKLSEPKQRSKERRTRNILLGESHSMRQIRSTIEKVANTQAPIYISGESGSGKELVARLIHQQGPNGDRPFVAINCGAIPHDLMESEFFGHVKGSFTGAVADKKGFFQAAHGGTLFLDEVADLPFPLQVKLLRAIQEKKIRPVGAHAEISVNIRILSATHQNLGQMVQEGRFRQDLYYRLNVIELSLPPLRKRPDDIPLITGFLLRKLADRNKIQEPNISSAALNALKQYYFPGNVRELENILERAIALFNGQCIDKDDLNLPLYSEQMPVSSFNPNRQSLEEYLEEIEKQALSEALEENRWNKTATAKQLGITFRSLRYRLKKLDME